MIGGMFGAGPGFTTEIWIAVDGSGEAGVVPRTDRRLEVRRSEIDSFSDPAARFSVSQKVVGCLNHFEFVRQSFF